MPMNRLRVAAAALLALTACGSFPFFGKKESSRAKLTEKMSKLAGKSFSYSRAKLEVHDTRYDGEYLQARLLISPGDGPLLLDKRINSAVDVDVVAVRDCSTGEQVKHIVMDFFPPRVSEEDILILEPGYWYGGEVRFLLFAEELTGMGPECIEFELELLSFDRKLVGFVFARATRTPQQSMDGGAQSDLPPVTDAGLPNAGGVDAGTRGMP
jgi:hypothetical protein